MTPPSVAEVRAWLQVPVSAVADEALQQVIDAEVILQAAAVRVPRGPAPDLVTAINRRVGRHLASRQVPLGLMGADAEYGPNRLARWDAEIERLEGPRRILVFG